MRGRSCGLAAAVWLLPFAVQAIPEGPAYPSAEWTQRELLNYAKTLEAPAEQVSSPAFLLRLELQSLANQLQWLQRGLTDPSWINPRTGNTPATPLCTMWIQPCAGDPFRYPGFDPFYEIEAEVTPVVFYDAACARLSGRVWKPRGITAGKRLPGVVIETGSIQAPEPLYWWMAQALVRAGYAVLTFDVRGQGRSDLQTPDFQQGGNFNSSVFWEGLVNVIDFFRSTPVAPYPHNQHCAGPYPTVVAPFNPDHAQLDLDRLGIVGHSLGASGVSIVQAYGAPSAEPWPGILDRDNPVDVVVAWDSLSSAANAVPRVPAMGQTSEYGIAGLANLTPPDAEAHKSAYDKWVQAGLPVFQFTIRGSTHFEWSLIPAFPASSWCPEIVDGQCVGGWGRPMAEHYSLAWLDRWLKRPGEPGYADADARLLADAAWQDRYSFHYRSARSFPTRSGGKAVCDDIRAGCADVVDAGDSGGTLGWRLVCLLMAAWWLRQLFGRFERVRAARI